MKKFKILILIIVIIAIALFIFFKTNDTKEEKNSSNSLQIIEYIIDEDNVSKLKEIDDSENLSNMIVVGENSNLHNKPNEKIIEKYNLSEYVSYREDYAKEIETLYLENLKYKVISSENYEDNIKVETVEIVTFYYQKFMSDLSQLASLICKNAGYSLKNIETDEKVQANYYKAETKAFQILSNYFKDYENFDDKITVDVYYENGNLRKGQLVNLMTYLQGGAYKNVDFSDGEVLKSFNERANNIYNDALNSGLLNELDLVSLQKNKSIINRRVR